MDDYQCPTCGRIGDDWGNDETKSLAITMNKGKQRSDTEDRAATYRKWRWGIGGGCYVSDIDHVEYRIVKGELKPVALLELTRVDGNRPIPETYLSSILARFRKRDAQEKIITFAARELKCKAWIVLFRHDLSQFWLYNLTHERGWYKNLSQSQYQKWILSDCGLQKGATDDH